MVDKNVTNQTQIKIQKYTKQLQIANYNCTINDYMCNSQILFKWLYENMSSYFDYYLYKVSDK